MTDDEVIYEAALDGFELEHRQAIGWMRGRLGRNRLFT
jgi:hypothetical protein